MDLAKVSEIFHHLQNHWRVFKATYGPSQPGKLGNFKEVQPILDDARVIGKLAKYISNEALSRSNYKFPLAAEGCRPYLLRFRGYKARLFAQLKSEVAAESVPLVFADEQEPYQRKILLNSLHEEGQLIIKYGLEPLRAMLKNEPYCMATPDASRASLPKTQLLDNTSPSHADLKKRKHILEAELVRLQARSDAYEAEMPLPHGSQDKQSARVESGIPAWGAIKTPLISRILSLLPESEQDGSADCIAETVRASYEKVPEGD